MLFVNNYIIINISIIIIRYLMYIILKNILVKFIQRFISYFSKLYFSFG